MKKNNNRCGQEKQNYQDSLMKIIRYNNAHDILVEFQDEYKTIVHTKYDHFIDGSVKNPYVANVFGVAAIGSRYPAWVNNKATKEYATWKRILQRCYDKNYQSVQPTYKNVLCCKEWLLFENFYDWLHCQENFNNWYNGERWALDKDILFKNNKLYSPNACCLVPQNVNSLFTKRNADRGETPIGVHKQLGKYLSLCQDPFTYEQVYLGSYDTPENAFEAYKNYKENIIKRVAQNEFDAGNITQACYDAMINYKVEIND